MDIQYDPKLVTLSACQADPGGAFPSESCDPAFEHDGVFPDAARLVITSTGGTSGSAQLGMLTFQLPMTASASAPVTVSLTTFTDKDGKPIAAGAANGLLCADPCTKIGFFGFIARLFGGLLP